MRASQKMWKNKKPKSWVKMKSYYPVKIVYRESHERLIFVALFFHSEPSDIEICHALKPGKPGYRSNRIAPSESRLQTA